VPGRAFPDESARQDAHGAEGARQDAHDEQDQDEVCDADEEEDEDSEKTLRGWTRAVALSDKGGWRSWWRKKREAADAHRPEDRRHTRQMLGHAMRGELDELAALIYAGGDDAYRGVPARVRIHLCRRCRALAQRC
jgi:hypothetical protein